MIRIPFIFFEFTYLKFYIIENKTKIIFIIPSLKTGGAERVMSFLATNINQEKFNSHLLVIGFKNQVSYPINASNTTFLESTRVSKSIPEIVRFLRANRPDIVMSAIAHLNTAMALISFLFPKIKFIGRETSIASLVLSKKTKFSMWSIISNLVPKRLSIIICQSKDMKKDLIENMGYPEEKLLIINNPISARFKLKKKNNNTIKQLITVGRLIKLKGHERIINALAALSVPFHYTIIGSGSEKKALVKKVKELKMESNVTFISFSDKIENYLHKSDLFLQGSYSEGFPNALLESCAVGTPVLTYVAPGGTAEIVESGVNGFIVKNEDKFIEKINFILNAGWSPQQVSESVTLKYNETKILDQYEQTFIHVLK